MTEDEMVGGITHLMDVSLSKLQELVGEGNGNPLQYSCLENPMDGGAWWAAVYGVAQSRTRLKRLSSSRPSFTPGAQSCGLGKMMKVT